MKMEEKEMYQHVAVSTPEVLQSVPSESVEAGRIVVSSDMLRAQDIDSVPLVFSEFQHHKDNVPLDRSLSWGKLKAKLSKHSVVENKFDGKLFSPVSYIPDATRGNEGVEFIYCYVADIDNGTPVAQVEDRLSGYAYLIYSSYSHTPEHPKYRVVILLSHPVLVQEWNKVWHQINVLLGGINDPATKDPARIYYLPSRPPKSTAHFSYSVDGLPLNPDELPPLDFEVKPAVVSSNGGVKAHSIVLEGVDVIDEGLNPAEGLQEVVGRCRFMQEASKPENQSSVTEPLWFALITNAARFEGSDQWVHQASSCHKQYSPEETNAKIIHAREKFSAPIGCDYIRSQGFSGCPSGGCKLPSGRVTQAPAGLWGHLSQGCGEPSEGQLQLQDVGLADFRMFEDGLYVMKETKDGEVLPVWIASAIQVEAQTRTSDSNEWGLLLTFTDDDGVKHSWAMPREMLSGSGEEYRKVLLSMGASIATSMKERESFGRYLQMSKPLTRALAVTKPGWHDKVYVMKDKAFGPSLDRVVLQTRSPDAFAMYRQEGEFNEWKLNVAQLAAGNSRLILAICTSLTGPVLHLLGEENGGFHFRGNSSIGKTITLAAASSVWGGKDFLLRWRATSNGVEANACRHNDNVIILDEMSQVDPKDAGEIAYMLANGQGKARAGTNAEARATKTWRLMILSTGEVGLADHLASIGRRVMAGQEIRLIDVPADAGVGMGLFEDIHGMDSPAIFANTISKNAGLFCGHAGVAFVEALADANQQSALLQRIGNLIEVFEQTYIPVGADGQVVRAGRRFAMVAAVGEVCIELGILPWAAGEAIEGVRKCYVAWIDSRGGVGNLESAQAIEQVRRFLQQHGQSRFSDWNDTDADAPRIHNRAGFRKQTPDGRTEFFVFPEVYRTEICIGHDSRRVTQLLVANNYLRLAHNDKAQVAVRLPSMGKVSRVYHILPDILGEAEPQAIPLVSALAELYIV